ncbi:type I-U CRISPR-associated RAMP protein Csb1/Cas7u [Nocardia sp. NRRL S-836]|uniref:type I-G CRISPR-associated RAMP protein Csb1/Cas7g n=1 Tax=Nocardia sp. NRRL S-836 TaxID=1519492 RepID=UPI0006AE0CF4|nr:type I-U CRISPR-associated RAMP protein Csb1/Cas7u [Nocardia sp. NRRL S-836]
MSPHRLVYDVDLEPLLGSTFQPTGFPDLGAATFDRFTGTTTEPALLVESVQSMANRLEATAWDSGTHQPHTAVTGLPHVRVERAGTGEFLTSSRLEAHRLASPFVREAILEGTKMTQVIAQRLGLAKDTPLNFPHMAAALAAMDPFCLLHGVFFAHKEWLGQPRFPRATSAVIEARNVRRAPSGGRKADRVRHQLDKDGTGGTSEGYGSVPFHRLEWTAERIVASFVVDTALLRSYGLPDPAVAMLETLALWEIRSLLTGGLRLRTACDLDLAGDITPRRNTPALPDLDTLTDQLAKHITDAADTLGTGEPIVVQWKG